MKILTRSLVLTLAFGLGVGLITYNLIDREALNRTDIAEQETRYLSEKVDEFIERGDKKGELNNFEVSVPDVLARAPMDPWGNEYQLSVSSEKYRICTGNREVCVLFD